MDALGAQPQHTGPPGNAATGGFDFTLHIRLLAADMAGRLDELRHIDLDLVAVRFCQVRKPVAHGLYASLTPLRFENGQRSMRRRGRQWTMQRLCDGAGREMRYLLSFYLPRFLNLSLREKLSTVVHELWHISPAFNGDLRRHAGRCYAHSRSQAQYDAWADALVAKWLSLGVPRERYAFLELSFRELQQRHGHVFGTRIRTPRMIAG